MGALTGLPSHDTDRARPPAGPPLIRRTTAPATVRALHAEIDNPLDLVAGHHLLREPPASAVPAPAPAACSCGHPVCRAAAAPAADPVRVFLVLRQRVAGAGLRALLAAVPDFAVVGSATDPDAALAAVRRVRPDVVLLGTAGDLGTDLAAAARLRSPGAAPTARVLLLRRAESTAEAARMLLAGAGGCFPLDLDEDQIAGAVALAAAGGTVFLPAPPPARLPAAGLDREAAERPPQQAGLTVRERQVLAQLGRGLSNAEIGRELALAEATVKKHLTQAMRKTGQPDRLRAALYAHRHGLAG
ncbi:DNA-binding response regulator [Streptomyces solincola]|uniref:DNA-binding response regulator n=1 Tax=Streptomyces solincola TaxID=2100817 RepID=A0A2S9PZV1_9ACTN|nr:response regulator transcription factor [Streptomyces solincola]PRH79949.1 DNA-binding response regulator [Streptomyces solincola]